MQVTAISSEKIPLRWSYIVVPTAILLVSLVLTAVFYSRLPQLVAYQFSGDTPVRWAGRTSFVTWTVVAQAALTLGAFIFVGTILLGARRWSVESPALKRLLPVMGNMVALPQIIILFAMLDVFLYNSYQVKLISLLAFALIVLAMGGAALGAVLVRAARQARRLYSNSNRE